MQQKLASYVYKALFRGQFGLEFLSKYIVAQSIFTATITMLRECIETSVITLLQANTPALSLTEIG